VSQAKVTPVTRRSDVLSKSSDWHWLPKKIDLLTALKTERRLGNKRYRISASNFRLPPDAP
jgi:hypothetical protein